MSEITGRRKPAIDSRDEEAIAGLFSELEHALQRCDGRALPLSIADADDLPTTEADAPTVPDAEGDSLGPYLLHRKIGNLSCGSVWVAEQREPTSRMVVLCVVNPGSDPNGILARFKAEQLTLALLGDRNIPPANSAKPVAGNRKRGPLERLGEDTSPEVRTKSVPDPDQPSSFPCERGPVSSPDRARKAIFCLVAIVALALVANSALDTWQAVRALRVQQDQESRGPEETGAHLEADEERPVIARPPVESPSELTGDSEPYEGPLRRNARRGVHTVTFPVPGGRPREICVIPQHLSFASYRGKNGEKDLADEKRLASYDFYMAGDSESGAIAISPKRKSTSAAVMVYKIPSGTSRPRELTAGYCRNVERDGKCVAKFKQTDNKFTTTSTASILGYYHVSRALGDICEIKPAVLRTMDIEQHKKVVRLASEMGVRGTVSKSWGLFNKYYANAERSEVADDLFTSDFTQIYGALLENTTGEEPYSDWLRAGTDLTSTRAFRNMADRRPVASILGSRAFNQKNVQALVAMRDMSELILLDYLLGQSDRLSGGNISSYLFAYYLQGGRVMSVKESKAPDLPPGTPRQVVRKLTIKDTDGGLLNPNVFERKGYLSRIRHLHPRTYYCLQTLARKWKDDVTVSQFFRRECTFSERQLDRFEKYLLNAAATLSSSRENGTLHLDLDLDDYFRGADPRPARPGITASVGRWEKGAVNRRADVETVQLLLTAAAKRQRAPALDPRGADGLIAPAPRSSRTVAAIESFEASRKLPVDGVIEPGSPSWQALLEAAGQRPPRESRLSPLHAAVRER